MIEILRTVVSSGRTPLGEKNHRENPIHQGVLKRKRSPFFQNPIQLNVFVLIKFDFPFFFFANLLHFLNGSLVLSYQLTQRQFQASLLAYIKLIEILALPGIEI